MFFIIIFKYSPEVDMYLYRSMDLQQASPMSKMDGTRLPSTPWHFGAVYLLQASKNDDGECCFS